MSRYYELEDDGKTPRPVSLTDWVHEPVHLGDETVDGVRISTVFLGMDHSFTPGGPPVLWETLVFLDGGEDGERYTSHEDALAGHERYLAKARAGAYKREEPSE